MRMRAKSMTPFYGGFSTRECSPMHDAKPVLTVLLLSGVGLLLLCLEWFSAAPHVREERLFAIAQLEAARTLPPRTLEVQAQWLLTHRLARLQSLGLLV